MEHITKREEKKRLQADERMKKLYTSGTDWGAESVKSLRRLGDSGGGIASLINESSNPFKRGQRIKFINNKGIKSSGTYMMASSDPTYIVLSLGGRHGIPAVIPLTAVITK